MSETPFYFVSEQSQKVTCRVCGRKGYGHIDPTVETAFRWQRACLEGHPHECGCGRKFTSKAALSGHRRNSPQCQIWRAKYEGKFSESRDT